MSIVFLLQMMGGWDRSGWLIYNKVWEGETEDGYYLVVFVFCCCCCFVLFFCFFVCLFVFLHLCFCPLFFHVLCPFF